MFSRMQTYVTFVLNLKTLLHVLGLTSRWKQVVAYYFTGNKTDGTHIADIIRQIVLKAGDIGLKVVAVTCDMGPVNRAMWKELKVFANNTRVTTSIPHPLDPDCSLYFLADVPHLIKNLKQAFLTHKTLFLYHETVTRYNLPSNCVNLAHVKDLLEFQTKKQLKIAPQLTDAILNPGQYEKMRVSHALHLFSKSVSAGLRYLVAREGRDTSYETTAWFIDLINKWFDLMSSRHPVMALSKSNSAAYQSARAHLNEVIDVINVLSIDARSAWKPVQTGIKLSTSSVLQLADSLLDSQPYLLTSRLTQDCLENLFSSVRLKDPTPSAKEFIWILKIITISQYLKSAEHGNYQQDDREYLADFLSAGCSSGNVEEEENSDETAIEIYEHDLSEDEECALYYLAGYCVRSLKRTRQLQCESCSDLLITQDPPNDLGMLAKLKEYKEGVLCHPSKLAYDACRAAEDVVRSAESSLQSQKDVVHHLKAEVMQLITVIELEPQCHNYIETLVKKFCTVRVKIMCRDITKKHAEKARENKKPSAAEYSSKSLVMRSLAKNVNKK